MRLTLKNWESTIKKCINCWSEQIEKAIWIDWDTAQVCCTECETQVTANIFNDE